MTACLKEQRNLLEICGPRCANQYCVIHAFLVAGRCLLLFVLIFLVHIRNSGSDHTLRYECARGVNEPFLKPRCVGLRIGQEGYERVESIAHGVHYANDHGSLLSVCTTDLVGPRHA